MSTESRKCATESVQREFTTRRGDWDRLAGCLSLGLVGWLNNLLRSLVKNQVSKKSWRFAMLLLTLVSITAGGQSAWAALLPDGGGVECLTFRHSNIPQLDPNLVQRYGRTVCGVYCSDKTYYRMACDADMFKDGFTIDDLRKGTKIGGFVLPAVSLTITKTGNGTITSTPTGINFTGINCGTDCSTEDYIPNTDVKLTAIASAGYVFDRWSGSCKGNDNSIVVKMDAAKSCTANFVSFVSNDWVSLEMPSSIRGTVWKDLNGDGIRQPTLGEVGFNSTTVFLKQGTSPELRMVTNLDGNYTTFSNLVGKQTLYVGTTTGWVQTYPANPQYYGVDLRQNQQVIGKDFGIAPAFDLAVTKIGTGDVKSTDGLINCGATCTGAYAINKAVTLQAAAGLGFQFDKWTGTGECNNNSANPINVQMIAAKTCTANFKVACSLALSVTPANWSLSRTGGTFAATINVGNCPTFAAIKWTASSNVSWLTVSPTSGSGNSTINTMATKKSFWMPSATRTITVYAGVAGSPKTTMVRQ